MRLVIIAGLVAISAVAAADDGSAPLSPLDPVRVVSPINVVQGDGVKIGEGTSFYPQIGVETGYVSNMFYTHDNPVDAGLLRFIVEAGAGSLSPQRRQPIATSLENEAAEHEEPSDTSAQGEFQYSANLYATWDQYLSDNDRVTAQGGLGLGTYVRALVHPNHPLSLLGLETFDRVLRAANFETAQDTDRDINQLQLVAKFAPSERTLDAMLIYQGIVDVFEDDAFQISDRSLNSLALRVDWRVLPMTQLYAQVSGGLDTGLGSSSVKVNSYPLQAFVGINTALTVKTTLIARIGYQQGFYEAGPDYQNISGGAYFDYRYSPLGRIRLMYDYEATDSINANFYTDHAFQAWFEQRVEPVGLFVSPVVRLREYQGVIGASAPSGFTRDDTILAVEAGVRYDVKNWLAASAEYILTSDQTDYRYMIGGMLGPDPSYVRHEVSVGVRAAY
jgi:hypothetical protein